jgi:hypothetical protein
VSDAHHSRRRRQVSNLMAAKMLQDVTNMEGKTDDDGVWALPREAGWEASMPTSHLSSL